MHLRRYILALFLTTSVAGAEDFRWTVQRFEGRDYLPLDQISAYYGLLPQVTTAANQIELESKKARIDINLESREIMINGVRQWLAFPAHKQDGAVFVSRMDLLKTIEPMLHPERIQEMRPVRTVVLDPGHGGHDKGAFSRFGFEKDFALDIARRARTLLIQRGINVVMTREYDVFVPLEDRAKIANRSSNSIFVSIHFNSSQFNDAANGFEIFSLTPRGAPSTQDVALAAHHMLNEPGNECDVQSAALASSVYHSLLGNIPQGDRGLKRSRFAVLRRSKIPAVLVEGGFLSNANDCLLIASAAWRNKFADAIVTGIENYKNLAEQKLPPKVVAEYRRSLPINVGLRDLGPRVITNSPQ